MNKEITVVDARMGRGKTTAAVRYMNEHRGRKRFLYVTPYLSEVDRICQECGFQQPESEGATKLASLKTHLSRGESMAATHALFYLLDETALTIIRRERYTLIIDESVNVVKKLNISHSDFLLVTQMFADEGPDGRLRWRDEKYSGRFGEFKKIADAGFLYRREASLLEIMQPEILRAFDEVIMLTYLFGGQYQKGYLDYFGFPYRVVGVERDENGVRFSDGPDRPEPVDYGKLISIIDNHKMNAAGESKWALSKNWYARRGYDDKDIRALRNGMRNFFQDVTDSTKDDRLWTCFKEHREKLIHKKTGRYRNDFLQVGARATNDFVGRTNIAYMVNRFVDLNIKNMFAKRGCGVDEDLFALSEMLQWIWRSAIRVGEPINLYIPSSRMRKLLTDWIEQNT